MRKPVVSGQFYPANKDELVTQIKSFKSVDFTKEQIVFAGIVPHAGYVFSGESASQVFQTMQKNYDVLIMLGPNHTGIGSTGICDQDWETPLGTVRFASDWQKQFAGVPVDNAAHQNEHSIEVQMPFVKYYLPDTPVVPIGVANINDVQNLADVLANVVLNNPDKNIGLVVSSDFTHYGPAFGYVPFNENIKQKMHELDKKAIDLILTVEPERFLDYLKQTKATICGMLPIMVLLRTCQILPWNIKGELLDYYTSGDVTGDYSNAVGYAGIVFEKKSNSEK